MESWCLVFMGNQLFGRNKPKDGFRTLYFPAVHKKFQGKERFCPQTIINILHIDKQPTIFLSKAASQQAGGDLYS